MRAGRLRAIGLAAGAALLALVLIAAIGSPMGLFSGKRPADLGLKDGKLRAGDWRPNWVCSQVPASDAKHHIEPLRFAGEAAPAWKALGEVIQAMPRATVVRRDSRYMHVEFSSSAMGFVDDAEFALDEAARLIHVRSGARLGVRDFDVNRERLESLRAGFAARANRGTAQAS
jgi:uncharacterized protein (DUF1499 family)